MNDEINEKVYDYDFGEITKYIQDYEKQYPNSNYSLELSDVKFSDNEDAEKHLCWVLSSNDQQYVFPEWEDVKIFLEASPDLVLSEQSPLTIESESDMITE